MQMTQEERTHSAYFSYKRGTSVTLRPYVAADPTLALRRFSMHHQLVKALDMHVRLANDAHVR